MRGKLGRATQWREETDQPRHRLAMALIPSRPKEGFRKLAGCRDLPWLAEALVRNPKTMTDAA